MNHNIGSTLWMMWNNHPRIRECPCTNFDCSPLKEIGGMLSSTMRIYRFSRTVFQQHNFTVHGTRWLSGAIQYNQTGGYSWKPVWNMIGTQNFWSVQRMVTPIRGFMEAQGACMQKQGIKSRRYDQRPWKPTPSHGGHVYTKKGFLKWDA